MDTPFIDGHAMHSNALICYKADYIYSLRENVRKTCNHLKPTSRFNFHTSKRNFAYNQLDKLLRLAGYPEISISTINNLFQKTSEKDTYGDEVFWFKEKTVAILQDFANRNLPLAQHDGFNSQHNSIADAALPYGLPDNIKRVLHNAYMDSRGNVTGNEVIVLRENGTALHTVNEILIAETDITHVMAQYRVFDGGKVRVLRAIEEGGETHLQVFSLLEQDDCLNYFVIFPRVIRTGEAFNYELQVEVEGFFQDLLKTGYAHVDRRAPVILKYVTLSEQYKFPQIPIFDTLTVAILRHPNSDLIGMQIHPIFEDGYKVYTINHGDLRTFNIEMVVEFRLDVHNDDNRRIISDP